MYLLDDNPESIRLNAPNSMLIMPFEGEQTDR
jgi:hypothetical protein